MTTRRTNDNLHSNCISLLGKLCEITCANNTQMMCLICSEMKRGTPDALCSLFLNESIEIRSRRRKLPHADVSVSVHTHSGRLLAPLVCEWVCVCVNAEVVCILHPDLSHVPWLEKHLILNCLTFRVRKTMVNISIRIITTSLWASLSLSLKWDNIHFHSNTPGCN